MKPYYDDGAVQIFHGDMREIFPTLETPAVVIADPPYGETRLAWDAWPEGWPSLMLQVPSLWCWGSARMFWDRSSEFSKFKLAQDLVWEKQNGTGMHNDRFRRVHELLFQFYPRSIAWGDIYHAAVRIPSGDPKRIMRNKKPAHWGTVGAGMYQTGSTRLMRSVLRARNGHMQKEHASAKPQSILRAIIEYSCPPGGVVVEPFMGGGGAIYAAKELGRRAIGIEIDEESCEKAAERLGQGIIGFPIAEPVTAIS